VSTKLPPFLPAIFLGLGYLLVSGVREQHVMEPRAALRSISSTLEGTAGRDLVVPEAERKVAGMSDYMMREFRNDSQPGLSVYVGYYERQVQGKSIHSPKNCLPGAGWEIMSSERVAIAPDRPGSRVNRVLLANKGVQALVYYWYQGRGRIEASEYRVKWELMRDAALYGRTEEALVRIVVPLPPGKAEAAAVRAVAIASADRQAQSVAIQLAREVERVLPAWDAYRP
jgi:EpsI family protein